jgi:hypothetical protein
MEQAVKRREGVSPMPFDLSMFRLDGKTAMVTGSGSGLGKA